MVLVTDDHGHPHGHHHVTDLAELDPAFDPVLRRRLAVAAVVLAVATLVGVAVIWPGQVRRADTSAFGLPSKWFDATVTRVAPFPCPGEAGSPTPTVPSAARPSTVDGPGLCVRLSFRPASGPDAGEVRSIELFDIGSLPEFRRGSGIVVSYAPGALPEFRYQLADRQRTWPMVLLGLAFAALVVVQGRLRGLAALAGLVASVAVIVLLVLPALVAGTPPVLVAVVASSLIAYLALYLAHGFHPLTTVALLGTLAALALVVLLSWAFTGLTTLSGLVTEDALYVRAFGGELNFSGLVLAGIILGALGAIDDMTVTQASSVAELRAANPAAGFRELYQGAIRIGRDHVASTVNTLALAYAGASLPLLLLFVEARQPLGRVVTSEVVATEVVRTLVGSIGLVAAVPITTLLAARLVAGRRPVTAAGPTEGTAVVPDTASDGSSDGPSDGSSDTGSDTGSDAAPAEAAPQDDWDAYLRRSAVTDGPGGAGDRPEGGDAAGRDVSPPG